MAAPGPFQLRTDSNTSEAILILPQILTSRNDTGVAETFMPNGPVANPLSEPFFQALGSNDRTCQTCHQPGGGWSITPTKIQRLFKSNPSAPLFRPIDGAVCSTVDLSTAQATASAYDLLLSQGLIRVFIPLPSSDVLQFNVAVTNDPFHCTDNPATGLTSPTSGIISQYRRPLPAANLIYLSTIMWDGREPNLASQAADAVQIHEQGSAPSSAQADQMANLEASFFSAQISDSKAGDLTSEAQGGAKVLATIPAQLGVNPPGPNFNSSVMTMYLNWNNNPDDAKAAVARGQNLFNERSFTISGVAGLNDVSGKPSIQGTCSACHNTPHVGSHSSQELLDLGLANAPGSVPGDTALAINKLPVLTVTCVSGPQAGTIRHVTDLGRALITGQCADIGRFKTATLRNLAARPPYFHNGSAPDLAMVVQFYDDRFKIGLTDNEKADLVAFLNTL
jgi:cytochrome c peroxidase